MSYRVREVAALHFSQHLAVDDPSVHGRYSKEQSISGAKLHKCTCPLGLNDGARRLESNSFCGRLATVLAKNSKCSTTSHLQALFSPVGVEWHCQNGPVHSVESITSPFSNCLSSG